MRSESFDSDKEKESFIKLMDSISDNVSDSTLVE